ncbi:uncharacterized protein LOC120658913 [Panicum virgatum]|jgi:hypothetical protein|uniref:Uncharacterized protein n=1 Tax=Panicum virgatum TaxID=38727 RepID=A0A8T0VN56_PANVG|nr:uncharacterized protein LOC120658913 [Panicum virgatum]KAG2636135.1 hypothetical protein PVAP13_2NG426700 [Panicum virgatum]
MSKMRMCKAPELLKKAATVFKSKTEALRTKLVVLASLRRKMAVVRAISHRIHALVSSGREKQARLEYGDGALVLRKVATGILQEQADHGHDDGVINLSVVAMFEEDDHGYPDWTHSLFNDDGYNDDEDDECHDGNGVLDVLGEPSVMDVIRSNREVEGLEFNMDDEIDQACDMFIRRFRKRMNRSF